MPPPSAAEQLRQLDEMSAPYQEEPSRGRGTWEVHFPGAPVDGEEGPGQTTLGEAGSEFLKGTGQGVVRSSPILGGLLGGARLGAMAAPYTGPAAPFMPAAGAVVGAGLGMYTGKSLEDLYNEAFPMNNKEDASIYRRGGQALGDSISFAPAAYYMPVMQGQRVGQLVSEITGSQKAAKIASAVPRFLSGIGEAARKYPKTFMLGELHGGLGASMGAMTAESMYPGEAGPAFVGEVAGGILSPSRWFTNATVTVIDALRTMRSTYSQGARETRAAEYLQNILEEGGENLPKLVARLRENIVDAKGKPITPTAAQKTGSLPLTMLERMLSKKMPEYAGENLEQGRQALEAYSLLVRNMKNIGTPEALQTAAALEKQGYEALLNGRLAAADVASAERIKNITQDTPAARQAIGQIVKDNTEGALRDSRDYEKLLWEDAVKRLAMGGETEAAKNLQFLKSEFVKRTRSDGKVYYEHKTAKIPGNPNIGVPEQPVVMFENWFEKVKDPRTGKMVLGMSPFRRKTTLEEMGDAYMAGVLKIRPNQTLNTYLDLVSTTTPELLNDLVPTSIQKLMTRLGANDATTSIYKNYKRTGRMESGVPGPGQGFDADPIPVYDLIDMRSNMLRIAREYGGKGEVNNARIYGELAESLLDDIAGAGQKAANPEAVEAFNAARQFSRSLNDVFTRTFAAQATKTAPGAVTKTGAEKLPPELLVTRAFGSNADVTALRMEELMDASKLIKTTYDDVVNRFGRDSPQAQQLKPFYEQNKGRPGGITDALTRVMRLAAADSIDQTTGRLNVEKLNKFVSSNKPILDKLGITADLTNAITAENALRAVTNQNSKLMQEAASQAAWAQVLKYEGNPVRALSDVIASKTPIKGVQNMAKLAMQGGPEAVKGLKSTLYDYAFEKAGGLDNFSPTKFYSIMFDEITPNGPSLVNIMRTQGLMTAQEGNNFKRLIYPMQRIEKSMMSKQMLSDDAENLQDMAVTLGLRIMGSGIGRGIQQMTPGGGGGASMVAASAGSKYLRDMVQKMPKVFIKQIIQEASQDPELMARLLTQPKTQVERFRMARSLHSYLAAAGLNFATFDEKEPQEPRPTGPSSGQMLRALPPAPPTTGLPGILGGPAKPATPKPGGAPGPQSGASFQSLFPFDSISPMLAARQQQPQPG
jgi:DNA-binding phage protein